MGLRLNSPGSVNASGKGEGKKRYGTGATEALVRRVVMGTARPRHGGDGMLPRAPLRAANDTGQRAYRAVGTVRGDDQARDDVRAEKTNRVPFEDEIGHRGRCVDAQPLAGNGPKTRRHRTVFDDVGESLRRSRGIGHVVVRTEVQRRRAVVFPHVHGLDGSWRVAVETVELAQKGHRRRGERHGANIEPQVAPVALRGPTLDQRDGVAPSSKHQGGRQADDARADHGDVVCGRPFRHGPSLSASPTDTQ